MDTPTNSLVRFGVFELDVRAGELRRSGRRLALQPQPLEILRALIERRGEVVTREELRRRLWNNGAYVDFDRSLNKAIVKLRDALGDDADSPRYIETLPRHGYRFIPLPQLHAHVDAAPGEISAPSAQPSIASEPGAAESERPSALVQPKEPLVATTPPTHGIPSRLRRLRAPSIVISAAVLMAVLLSGVYALWHARSGASVTSVRVEAPSQSGLPANVARSSAVAFAPPPHSIAVLPFVNLSGEKEQEYFSDGLTEELLNSLAHIDGLQVAARTSSFSFREHPDIADVAHKLNVATVLEGSVRRLGPTVRVTAKLVSAGTGFHVWSKTYDRDLGDVLKLQTEIATAVASALEVTLLRDAGAKIELGGTHNPAAFDSYLRALRAVEFPHSAKDVETAIAALSEAIRLDPNYALAFAGRSVALHYHAWAYAKGAAIREDDDRAHTDARQAIALAPELAEGHLALALALQRRTFDFALVSVEFERALALAPGNARVLGPYGSFAASMGRTDSGIAAARRAVVLDPLNPESHGELGVALFMARRYAEAAAAFNDILVLDPLDTDGPGQRGVAYYGLGDFERARASCEAAPDNDWRPWCLALTYHKLDRHADAEIALAKVRAAGDRRAYDCATIYAQWGNTSQALQSLELAWRLRLPDLRWLKADPLMDPLRKEPRFQAIERALKYP